MKLIRWCELITLFIVLPTIMIALINDIDAWLMPVLFAVGTGCLIVLLADQSFKRFRLWHTVAFNIHVRQLLALFLPLSIMLSIFVYFLLPDRWFDLPSRHQQLWLTTLLIYPLVSVIPQELIFRTYFFHRYKRILPSKTARWILSSLCFGMAHTVYGNWIAVVLSCAGGLLFGYRYMQTRSTLIVVLEHSLWGYFLFTVGLGTYFLTMQQSM
ncbi:CPBP family intramembrane metalloprotease [Aestuariibacter sp. AA17]|uniref:CPBP family intramembrane metalloprotease n=1 Tax=Fluctibacter corallii TaxID=2984329 RepID=A0ABT3A9A3_9ALTE|nr:CPBP family intramembrane glutamic endopeptidase [Aestuariibacter sp. AA17]MCV2885185.1 CPBP family intramembrane metalloprotease [Aestuariibacter sp. AA17]